MKVLVTGGAGFIGSHVADALLEAGHEVHVLDSLVNGYRHQVPDGAVFHALDLSDPAVSRLFETHRFEALLHLAAQIDVRKSVADPAYDAQVNVLGMLRLLEAGRAHGLRRVVFSSSGGAIYGEPDRVPQQEADPERPMSPYGVSKLVSERYLAYYARVHGLTAVSLRYANVYGPRQTPEGDAGVISRFIDRMQAGAPVTMYGDGAQTRDYVFVGDVVQANLLALDQDASGAYNIGTGVETSVLQLYRHLADALGQDPGYAFAAARTGEIARSALDASLAAERLGWRPAVALPDGLSRTIGWFKSRAAGSPLR
ncbi:MAG: NAD-dependent epimerase/dehydratase family protein [Rhodothermales bacterium]